MTIPDLVERIRNLHKSTKKAMGSNYNEKADFFVDFGPPIRQSTLGLEVGNLLHRAYTERVFYNHHGTFGELHKKIQGNDSAKHFGGHGMTWCVIDWLRDKGHDVTGASAKRNPFDRLADALVEVTNPAAPSDQQLLKTLRSLGLEWDSRKPASWFKDRDLDDVQLRGAKRDGEVDGEIRYHGKRKENHYLVRNVVWKWPKKFKLEMRD